MTNACNPKSAHILAQDLLKELDLWQAHGHFLYMSFSPSFSSSFFFFPGGAGKARFNVATPTTATVTCTALSAYVLPYNFQTKSI